MQQLKTNIIVESLVRRVNNSGAFIYIQKKGDLDLGSILVKINYLNGNFALYEPLRDMNGKRVFVDIAKDIFKPEKPESFEMQIDNYLEKRHKNDSDLWIIEIEDKAGQDFLADFYS